MRPAIRLLTLLQSPFTVHGAEFNYLLRDDFLTDANTPLTSPRTCEPGPGTLTITDTTNKVSISSGQLVFTTNGVNDPRLMSQSLTDVVGRAVLASFTTGNASPMRWVMGFHTANTATPSEGIYFSTGTTVVIFDNGTQVSAQLAAFAATTTYQVAVVRKTAGCYMFIKGGDYTNWTLLFSTTNFANAAIFAGAGAVAATAVSAAMDNLHVRDLGSPFTTNLGIATQNVATPVSGTTYTNEADAEISLTVTAPGSLTGTKAEVRYRWQDDSNYWVMYFDAAGAFKVDWVLAGTPTNVINVAGAIIAGATRTMRVGVFGTRHRFYTLNGTTWTAQGISLVSHMDTKTTIKPVLTGAYTMANLINHPSSSSVYDQLSEV